MNDEQPRIASTAYFIARCLLVASHEPRYAALCSAGVGERCRRLVATAGGAWFVRAAKRRWFRSAFQIAVNFFLPGIIAHYLARKRCLEDWLRGSDCRQVVVLGAGLDTLAWRLSGELPGVRFLEVDRPAALRIKARAVGGKTSSDWVLLPADLDREPLARVLAKDRAFDPVALTLFVAEGLSMYLPPARVRSLLGKMAGSGGPRVLALSFMEARTDGRIAFRHSHGLVDRWLRWQGEPFRWSLPPGGAAAFLADAGWHLREPVGPDILRDRYLTPAGLRDAPLAAGEWLVLAQNFSP